MANEDNKLVRKMKIKLNGIEVGETPMLIPSFSSRANINVTEMIDIMKESTIGLPILVSAYDVCYSGIFPESSSNLIFLDSGGYECAIDNNISETGYYSPEALEWNEEKHLETIQKWDKMTEKWSNPVKTVLISYDHPSKRLKIQEQIDATKKLFDNSNNLLKEFLIKPEKEGEREINLQNLLRNINLLASFDIFGVTEKELGNTIFDRMVNLAKIRIEMDRNDINIPIHVFGSLDTITTPLYYFAGADIFDGLSWLRFTFHGGNTLYTSSAGPKLQGIHNTMTRIEVRSFHDNITYLRRLKMKLEEFENDGDFNHFGIHSKFFDETHNQLMVKVR